MSAIVLGESVTGAVDDAAALREQAGCNNNGQGTELGGGDGGGGGQGSGNGFGISCWVILKLSQGPAGSIPVEPQRSANLQTQRDVSYARNWLDSVMPRRGKVRLVFPHIRIFKSCYVVWLHHP